MGVAIMLRAQAKDQGEYDESNCALFLSGENKHAEPVAQAHMAYGTGSARPASAKPFNRNWQASQTPQANPSALGS